MSQTKGRDGFVAPIDIPNSESPAPEERTELSEGGKRARLAQTIDLGAGVEAYLRLDAHLQLQELTERVRKLSEALELVVVRQSVHEFAPHAYTIACILSTSHMVVHTWPEYQFIVVDLFSCGIMPPPDRTRRILEETLGGRVVRLEHRRRVVEPSLPRPGLELALHDCRGPAMKEVGQAERLLNDLARAMRLSPLSAPHVVSGGSGLRGWLPLAKYTPPEKGAQFVPNWAPEAPKGSPFVTNPATRHEPLGACTKDAWISLHTIVPAGDATLGVYGAPRRGFPEIERICRKVLEPARVDWSEQNGERNHDRRRNVR